MSIKTISKIACFVIPLLFGASCTNFTFGGPEQVEFDSQNAGFARPEVLAHIASKEINESSGLAVSKCQNDVFWTHNDSGDGPFIYAFNSKGESLGTFRVPNIDNIDWEDIATLKLGEGRCYIYVGEIGDNDRKRDVHKIYRIAEPAVTENLAATTRKSPVTAPDAEILRFRYPDERHNAEALLVEPNTQLIYVVTKQFDGPAKVFRIEPNFDKEKVQTAEMIAEVALPALPAGLVTGGDISPDGKRIVLCDYYAGYEFRLPRNSSKFADIWKQKPSAFDLGPREIGEAVAFGSDADSIFADTEGPNAPLIRIARKKK